MPISNRTKDLQLNVPVISAYSIKSRLAGLCGLDEKTLQTSALHLRPCGAIHTFYLKTAIDVMFLDSEGRLLSHQIGVPPNKILLSSRKAQSVLEARTGVLSLDQFQEGDYIAIVPEAVSKPHWSSFRSLLHLPVNLFMAVFWFRFVLISFYNVLQSGSWFGLGLLLFNSLLVFFFLTRRISSDTSARLSDWLVAWSTVILSMSLKPHPAGDPALQMISLGLQAVGLSVMLYSLLSLGKSFGIVPANRSIILSGAYAWIRHPLYASEMVFYAGFLFGNPTVLNSLSIFVILLGQLWRVRAEETLLVKDIQYREYCLRVPYRFIPKLF